VSYRERVETAAAEVATYLPHGWDPVRACELYVHGPEMRLPPKAAGRREFVRQVVARARKLHASAVRRAARVPKVRLAGVLVPATEADNLLAWSYATAVEEWGRCFPDCDPSDRLLPRVARQAAGLGIDRDDAVLVVDAAFRKLEGCDWSTWQASAFDQIVGDYGPQWCVSIFGTATPSNPWRTA